jgi:hypothetical protein
LLVKIIFYSQNTLKIEDSEFINSLIFSSFKQNNSLIFIHIFHLKVKKSYLIATLIKAFITILLLHYDSIKNYL